VTRAREKANLTQKVTTSEPTQLTNGMIWLDTDAVAVSQQSMRWTKTPSGGTTVLSGASDTSITLSYSVGQEQVYANGVLLIRGSDYTASDGTSITLASASVAGDVFEIISIIPLTLVDTYTQTQADGKFVNNTLADAKGDLIVGTADNTISKLTVGSTGQSLVADSTTTSGLRWQDSFVSGKNKIINGDFGIWQRGTSYTPTNSSTQLGSADRWQTFYNGSAVGTNTVSRQTFTPGQTAVPGNPTYFIRTTTNGSATQNATDYYQKVEDVSTFAGQTVTLSFWAQASNSGTIALYVDQNFGSGGSTTVEPTITASASNFTTTWAKYTATVTLPSISGKTVGAGNFVGFRIRNFSTLTSGTFDLAQVQLEAGSVATPFTTASGTIGGELALCQRYYYRMTAGGAYSNFTFGMAVNGSTTTMGFSTPVTMRVTPTSVDYTTLRLHDTVSSYTVTSIGLNGALNNAFQPTTDVQVSSGLTQYRTYYTSANNSTSAYIGFSAEL
jgi:hypothetical protein